MNDYLPMASEVLIRGAVEKLAASRKHFKSKLVADARELLELVIRDYGTLKPKKKMGT